VAKLENVESGRRGGRKLKGSSRGVAKVENVESGRRGGRKLKGSRGC
jgi:hypothetical protein